MRFFVIILVFYSCSILEPNKSPYETFDFKKHDSIEFLDFLADNANKLDLYMVNPNMIPENWVKDNDLNVLIERLESTRVLCPVYSIRANITHEYKIRSTEGLEALYILESVRSGLEYPMKNGSRNYGVFENGIYYPDPLRVMEVIKWFKKRNE